ncbi:hypothetical protein F5Y06DRAFT_265656 [Hypoxylon sp. FL0890]|nr:hypothetical protein F5Y06DRAFT_265656 [Hypoxylon sp. FL0890]
MVLTKPLSIGCHGYYFGKRFYGFEPCCNMHLHHRLRFRGVVAGREDGPRTLPIVGNMHLMPTFKPYKQFTE